MLRTEPPTSPAPPSQAFGRRFSAPRVLAVSAILLLLLMALTVASLTIGARDIPMRIALDALRHPTATPDHAVVHDLRLPRTLLGLLVGSALAVAGVLMQAVSRNPLAEPGLLGVNAGAAFAVILSVAMCGPMGVVSATVWAMLGALGAAVLVWVVGGRGRHAGSPARLALAGVALGAVLMGIGQAVALGNPQAFDRYRAWHLGSLDVRSLEPVQAIAGPIALGLVLALALGPLLNTLGLGDDVARALGAPVAGTRLGAVIAITLLAGASTAVVGGIGFLGLMVPHAARRLVGSDQRHVLAISLLLGPVVLLAADVLGRRLTSGELPVGVTMAFLGGPVLVAVARAHKVRGL